MALDLNDPDVKSALEAAVDEAVGGLKKKNAELLRKLEAAKEIKPEDYQRAMEERDAAQAALTETQKGAKELKSKVKLLEESLTKRTQSHEKTLVDDQLTNALVKAGVRPEFLDFVKAFHRGNAKVIEDNGDFKALLGDKPIDAAVAEWVASDAGKAVIAAPANGGGGASGSRGSSGVMKLTQAEFEAKDPAIRKKLMQEGKVEITT